MVVFRKKSASRFTLKMLSVLISLLLWLYVSNSEQVTVDVSVPVEVVTPTHIALLNNIPKEVIYSLKGPRAIVRLITDRKDKIIIDLRNQQINPNQKQFYSFKSNDIDLPLGVNAQKILPSSFEMIFDEKIKKILPLQVQFLGTILDNYKLVSQKIVPNTLELYGPKKELINLKEVFAGPVDLGSLHGEGKKFLPINGLSDNITIMNRNIPELQFNVKAMRANLILKNIPIKVMSKHRIIKQSVTTVTLMVLSNTSENEKLNKNDVIVEVLNTDDKPGEHNLDFVVKLPPKMDLVKVIPDKLKLKIE